MKIVACGRNKTLIPAFITMLKCSHKSQTLQSGPVALFKRGTLQAICRSQELLDRSLIHLLLQMRNERLFDVTVSCLDSTITLIPCLALYSI